MRVLIVEDEYYLADDLAQELRGEGADVVGPVGTLEDADAALAGPRPDFAIVDINLHGEMAFPIADRLAREGIPFLIATGYSSASLPPRFSDLPRVEKPFVPGEVLPHILAAKTAQAE